MNRKKMRIERMYKREWERRVKREKVSAEIIDKKESERENKW